MNGALRRSTLWSDREVALMMALFGAIVPRVLLLIGWVNAQAAWEAIFGAPVWFLAGFLFLPWTTFVYGFISPNGMSLLNWIFLGGAFLVDLGTWGIGALSARKAAPSNFRVNA
jgi:hypothetical protein